MPTFTLVFAYMPIMKPSMTEAIAAPMISARLGGAWCHAGPGMRDSDWPHGVVTGEDMAAGRRGQNRCGEGLDSRQEDSCFEGGDVAVRCSRSEAIRTLEESLPCNTVLQLPRSHTLLSFNAFDRLVGFESA
jgi:hypothetical protein